MRNYHFEKEKTMATERNAIILSAEIFIEDHGNLSAYVNLSYGGSGQGFGGYALDNDFASVFIRKVMEVVGVTKWEDLRGKSVRVIGDDYRIVSLGNIIKDVWFTPSDYLMDKLK
jgi:hypothetical protein